MGPPLSRGIWSVQNTVQILLFLVGNESFRERDQILSSPLQTPALSQHFSWLFIRCKHLGPVSPSALAHTLYIFIRVPAHRQVFEHLHLHPHRPQGTTLGIACSAPPRAVLRSGSCKCFFTRIALLLWPSRLNTDLAVVDLYQSTQYLYIHRVFLAYWLLQLQNKYSEIVFKITSVQSTGS